MRLWCPTRGADTPGNIPGQQPGPRPSSRRQLSLQLCRGSHPPGTEGAGHLPDGAQADACNPSIQRRRNPARLGAISVGGRDYPTVAVLLFGGGRRGRERRSRRPIDSSRATALRCHRQGPISNTRRASCVRDLTPSLRKTLWRWYSTVLWLMKSWAAISRLFAP
jgi:hypothetical protein